MKTLLKSLLLYPSEPKLARFREVYSSLLKGRDGTYTAAADLYLDAKLACGDAYPSFKSLEIELVETQETSLLAYLKALEEDMTVPLYSEDAEYVAHVKTVEKVVFESDVFGAIAKFQHEIKASPVKDLASIVTPTENLVGSLFTAKNKLNRVNASTSGLLFGDAAVSYVENLYQETVDRKNADDFLYYDVGIPGFAPVKIARGDLVVIGGFTSHGKSLFLRNIVYRFLTEYRMNCYYCSLEMSYDKMVNLFLVLHANNRAIFPHGVDIPYVALKNGTLTEEQRYFLHGVVAPDFFKNEAYGTLFLEYPNDSSFKLSDLQARVQHLENTEMPIHAVGTDYLTMMNPIETGKGRPQREDYNEMVKRYKNGALSHRRKDGMSAPYVALTPAQISRGGLDEAIKNNNFYELKALREYNELEASADIVFTTMLLAEMRAQKIMKIQNLKNRDGDIVVDPLDVSCQFDTGFGLYPRVERNESEKRSVIESMLIGMK